MDAVTNLLSGQTIRVFQRHGCRVYAQKLPESMMKGWQDRALEGDDHWGVITSGEIVTYVCTHTVDELEYGTSLGPTDPGHSESGKLQLSTDTYHLLMWRGRFVWVDDRKAELFPV